jgi:DNA-binding NarL/FixJ family response regulator
VAIRIAAAHDGTVAVTVDNQGDTIPAKHLPRLFDRFYQVGTPKAPPDGLTAREVEILGLVALGLSNREVGAHLHISEHTTANHVRSILRKTGCANRTEATGYAHRRALVPG